MALQPPTPPGPPMAPPPGMPPMMPAGAKPPGPPQMMGAPGQVPPPPGAPLPPPNPDDQDGLGPHVGFFNQPWVQTVLPLVTSLAAHAGIVVLVVVFGFVARAVVVIDEKPPVEDQVIIPDATLAEANNPGAVPNFGDANDPLKPNRQDKVELPTVVGTSQNPSPDVSASAAGGGDSSSASAAMDLGRGAGGGKGGGTGGGVGDGIGAGTGTGGGPPAPYGIPSVGGARGPQGPVFGSGGNARKIVFVCDATGTMINKMSVLKRELVTTVTGLKNGIQSYKIVFYTDAGTVVTEKRDGLIVCSPVSKKATFDWLTDVTPAGTTDPVPAIQAAFALKPDLIYFLSDGEFNNLRSYDKVVAEVERLSKEANGRIKVNTILFETIEPDAEKVMQDISSKTGGRFNKVTLKELESN